MGQSYNIHRLIHDRMTLEARPGGIRVPFHYREELRGLVSTLSFRWDVWYNCWNVVCHPKDRMPYIVFQVTTVDGNYRDVGADTLTQVRKSIWWSTEGIARHARDMQNESVYAKAKIERDIDDRNRDFAKEMTYPMMNQMRGNGEGNTQSNFMFAGRGEGKLNVNSVKDA